MLKADRATRTITADPLLPYGEQGRTNLGRVTASKGRLEIPSDVSGLVLNMQHERNAPLAKFVSVEETDTGLRASFRVPETRAGDDLLAEVENGLRTGVSVEIDNPVIRNGQLLGGTLTGAAAVVDPAFPSATLIAADAGDLPEKTPEDEQSPDDTDDESEDKEATVADETTVETVETDEEKEQMQASLPKSLQKNGNQAKPKGNATLFAALAGSPDNMERARLTASLDQAVSTDLLPTQQKQWLGEVWAGKTYERRFATLVNHDNLAGMQAIGWKFTSGKTPAVAPYSGFPAQPNSNEVVTEQVTLTAARIAGAGEVDRAWVDFSVPEFWSGYYRECTDSYERQIDHIVRDALISSATAVDGGTVPTGVSTAAAYIVDGALSVIAQEKQLPSFAMVGSDLYRDLLLTRADDVVAFLNAALGLEDGSLAGFRIVPSSVASLTGKVLVGAKGAATLFELPGASPVRVDTVNIANGGVTTGVFGYHAELVNDASLLALVA